MELVPILSTIILVGTIATFILAVFAYFLYKARERRSRSSESRSTYTARRQQPQMAQGQPARPIQTAAGQPSPASMYIAPTTTLPPQGPVVQVHEAHEAAAPAQGWARPNLEHATAAPVRPSAQPGDGGYAAPRLAAPAQPGSLFWEYTDEGFVPVQTRTSEQTPVRPRQEARPETPRDNDEGIAWL